MQPTAFTKKQIEAKVKKWYEKKGNQYPESGLHCFYFQLDDHTGLKCYHDEIRRDSAFAAQKQAFSQRLAPAVGKVVEVTVQRCKSQKPTKFYAYTTEHMKLVSQAVNQKLISGALAKEINKLANKIDKITQAHDTHQANVGFRCIAKKKPRKLYWLDFGFGLREDAKKLNGIPHTNNHVNQTSTSEDTDIYACSDPFYS